MNLNTLFDRPIAFHRCFVTITGSVTAALMLSQAFYWSKRTSLPDGWFYKSQAEWHEETGLSRREQETARKVLRNLGIFSEKLIGIPATLHYKINQDVLSDLLKNLPEKEQKTQSNIDAIKYGANVQTGMAQTSILDDTKRTNWNGANEHTITENTNRDYTETTTDIKTRAKAKPKKEEITFVLPDWIDKETWNLWMKTRKGKMIPEQMQFHVNQLEKWKNKGLDYMSSLEKSAGSGYQGLFEPEQKKEIKTFKQLDEEREAERRRKLDIAAKSMDFGEGLDDNGFPIPGYDKFAIPGECFVYDDSTPF